MQDSQDSGTHSSAIRGNIFSLLYQKFLSFRAFAGSLCNEFTKKATRTPSIQLEPTVKGTNLPRAVSVCFGDLSEVKSDEILVRIVLDVCDWCKELGIYDLSIFDKVGLYKSLLPFLRKKIPEDIIIYSLDSNKTDKTDPDLRGRCDSPGILKLLILDVNDGKPLMPKLAKTIARDRKSKTIDYEVIRECIYSECKFRISDPDIIFVTGTQSDSSFELYGYPFWLINYSEFWLLSNSVIIKKQGFIDGINAYCKTSRRFGR